MAVASSEAAAILEAVLAGCLSNDNQVRKQAEDAIKVMSAQPHVVGELLRRLQQSANPEVRQLAALLLRKRITRHWQHLTEEVKAMAKTLLLERVAQEPEHGVRRSVGEVVGVIAKHTVPRGEWPEVLGFLHQCSQSGVAAHRELALELFGLLTETIGDCLAPHALSLQAVVRVGLQDSAESVRVAALKAMTPLMQLMLTEEQISTYHTLVAAALKVAADAVASGSEDVVVLVCQLLVELTEFPAPLLQPHLPAAIELAARIAMNTTLELPTREQALQVVQWVARFKPKQLSKHKALVKSLLHSLCMLCCEPIAADHEESLGTPAKDAAAATLDVLSLHLSSQIVAPQLMDFQQTCAGSADPNHRTAGIAVLAVASEGCAEAFRKKLGRILPGVLKGLQDPDPSVRGAAAFAIGQFSMYCMPEIVEHYEAVLPRVFAALSDPSPDVQERACYALDTFCENMDDDEILPYMPQLMTKLVEVLHHSTRSMQGMALSAIASTVAAAQAAFEPYAGPVLPILIHFMSSASNDMLPCRCRATEVAGLILEYLGGREPTRSSVPGFMELGLKGFGLHLNELNEYSHGMFSCAAKALGADFAQYLPVVVPLAIESCEQNDGDFGDTDSSEEEEAANGNGMAELSDDDDSDGGERFRVRTGVLDEKCAATMALGMYAEAAPAAFAAFLPQTVEVLKKMSEYYHEEVRMQASEAFARLALSAHAAFPGPLGPDGALSAEACAVLQPAVAVLLDAIADSDKSAVASGFLGAAMVLKGLGLRGLGPQLEVLATTATSILEGKAKCQEVDEDDEPEGGEEADEDEAADDEELLQAVVEILPVMAAAAGPDAYAPVFAGQHLYALLGKLRPGNPAATKAAVVGGLAEVATCLKAHMSPHLEKLLPFLLREMRSSEDTNRQNSTFCCGVLAEGCGVAMMPYVQAVLTELHRILMNEEEADGVHDNALGATARIVLACPGLPLDKLLPPLLAALPVRSDFGEAAPVYGMLMHLLTGPQAAEVAPQLPHMVQALAASSTQTELSLDVRRSAAACLAALGTQYPQHLVPLLAALPADQREALTALTAMPSLC